MNKHSTRRKPTAKSSHLTEQSKKSISTKKSPKSPISTSVLSTVSKSITTTSRSTLPRLPTTSTPQFTPQSTSHTPSRTPFQTSRRFKRQKTYFVTGPYFEVDNDALPIPEGNLYYIDNIPLAAQFRNQYHRSIQVPCLLTTEDQRIKQSAAINQSGNRILTTLKEKIAAAEKNKKPFYLVALPMTPDYSIDPNKLYNNDPDEYNLPLNKYTAENNADKGWGDVLKVKTDMMEIWLEHSPKGMLSKLTSHAQGDQVAGAQTNRVSQLIQNRLKNPDLYHTFGLDENVYQTRLTMYAIHAWLYCRAVQYRPVHNSESYRKAILTVLDNTSQSALYYDFKFLNGKDRHSMIQLLLPWYRTFMINMDKAFTSLAGGDPEPMYGLLYRTLYRTSEPDRMDPKKTAPFVDKDSLKGYPYSPDVEVFMLSPPSLSHINTLINYIVNCAFDMHTKSPRDYNLMLNGFIDLIDWPSVKQKDQAAKSDQPAAPQPGPGENTQSAKAKANADKTDKIETPTEQPSELTPPPTPPQPVVQKLITPPSTNGIESEIESATKPHVELHKGRSLLKPLSRDEMIRWSYPVYQAQKSFFMPGLMKRTVAAFIPQKPTIEKTNWFLNPRDETQPAWRPPQFALTETGRKE